MWKNTVTAYLKNTKVFFIGNTKADDDSKGTKQKSEIIYSETDKQMHIHTPHATVPSSGRVLTDFPKLSFSFLARKLQLETLSPKFQQML